MDGGSGIRADVNGEVNFFLKFKKKNWRGVRGSGPKWVSGWM